MELNKINYNTRIKNFDRLKPKLTNSRYVHLTSLNKVIQSIVDVYLKKKENIKLADFGCGEMPYYELIKNHCKEYLAVDIPGNPKANRTVNLETNKCDIESNYCDIVWSIQVLEHVENYDKYLTEAHRILHKNGVIIASTHGQWKYHPDPIDFWRWTSEGLKTTFERNNFEIIDFKGSLSFLTTSLQLFQDAVLLSFPFASLWQKPFCTVMQLLMICTEKYSYWSKTLNTHRNLDSDVYFVIARKK